MQNYYSILGIEKNATITDVKRAYRLLAKKFHPDVMGENVQDYEKFNLIKQAYETLSNKSKRFIYDEQLKQKEKNKNSVVSGREKRKQRQYDFSEEAMKRRRYYQEMYGNSKKVNQPKKKEQQEVKIKNPYSEFHFILISIPIAVALLFLIVNKYENKTTNNPPSIENEKKITEGFSTSDQPFQNYFGEGLVNRNGNNVIEVNNKTKFDAVVCLIENRSKKTIRHHYIANNYNLLFEFLPENLYQIKFALLKNESQKDSSLTALNNRIFYFQGNKEVYEIKNLSHDTFRLFLKPDTSYQISKDDFFK